MSSTGPGTLRALVSERFTERDLGAILSPQARLLCAVTDWDGLSLEQAASVIVAETLACGQREIAETFTDQSHEAIVISGIIEGEPTRQLLLATYGGDGGVAELRSYFKYMYPFTLIREAVMTACGDLPAQAWAVQALDPDSGETHDSIRNFPYADDLVFYSPVLRKGAAPEPLAYKVLCHASSIYGVRRWSDLALTLGDKRLGFFDADIQGQAMEMANVLTFSAGKMSEIVSFARPWPTSMALYSRIKARLVDQVEPEFFWDEQPDFDSYL